MNPYVLTFFVNVAVLVFEITGARLVAPYFGASTDIWSAIIATVIGGLSLGYYVGGIQADRGNVEHKLALVLAGSGVTMLFLGVLSDIILPFIAALGSVKMFVVAPHVLIGIGAFFFVPPFLLGVAYPLLVKRVLTRIERSGHEIGLLSAVGALGSIVGALGTGLFLLPVFGSQAVVVGAGMGLLVLSGLSVTSLSRAHLSVLALSSVIGLASLVAPLHASMVADIDSAYGRIMVQDELYNGSTIRTVRTDAFGVQCAMFMGPRGPLSAILAVPYLEKMRAVVYAHHDRDRIQALLFVGGCNYSLPRVMGDDVPHASIDVVEINPQMTTVAEQFFDFSPDEHVRVIHEDGRVFLNQAQGPYDAIVLDAFGSGAYIPFHLATAEMFVRVREALTDDGIVVMNVLGGLETYNGTFVASMYETLRDVFPTVRVYKVNPAREGEVQNLLFVATTMQSTPELEGDVTDHVAALSDLVKARVLTDDWAPVEQLVRSTR